MKSSCLKDFLYNHKYDKNNTSHKLITHTKIGLIDNENKESNKIKYKIYPGKYYIPKEDREEFYKHYVNEVFMKKKKEYLTEKQLKDVSPLLLDFDFRYDVNITAHQHSKYDILNMINCYLHEIQNIFQMNEDVFSIYIFEKKNVNVVKEKDYTKDGIHVLFSLHIEHEIQEWIRNQMIMKLQDIWKHLPLTNTFDKILDDGITKGCTNWQLYGSRKPLHEAYELTYIFDVKWNEEEKEFFKTEKQVGDFDMKKEFYKLSIQNDDIVKWEVQSSIQSLLIKNEEIIQTKKKVKENQNQRESSMTNHTPDIYKQIKNKKELEQVCEQLLMNQQELWELHLYTQALPSVFYEPGSHLENRKVAFALKNTNDKLFISWVALRSKATDFNYGSIPELLLLWNEHFNKSFDKNLITKKSIMYWCKLHNPKEYENIKSNSLSHFINMTLETNTEYDVAKMLNHVYKDLYVCVGEKMNIWYYFDKHKWVQDSGNTLRNRISEEIYYIYKKENMKYSEQLKQEDKENEETLKKKKKSCLDLMILFKKTGFKDKVMKEASEIFYDANFLKKIDYNKYILCFDNGVFDFTKNIFRDGLPEDYITKSTNLNYIPFENIKNDIEQMKIVDEINLMLSQLYPIKELNEYMLKHFASLLIGGNKPQTLHMYHGSGSNGKSKIIELLSVVLGDYFGTIPLSLLTEKRTAIGQHSSEVIQLKGLRLAVMQEASKNQKLNEGIMKELTGDKFLTGREIYCKSEKFEIHFKIVVCLNNLFDIISNDDGTWRRIRKIDHLAKYVDDGETIDEDVIFVYKKNKNLDERFPVYAPIFASMLIEISKQYLGDVPDCEYVIRSTHKYRMHEDHIACFIYDNIVKTGNNEHIVKKLELFNQCKLWFEQEYGKERKPKGEELYQAMDKQFGKNVDKVWRGICIRYPGNTDNLSNDIVLV
jgi:phage/plasmid-associated DNA primase